MPMYYFNSRLKSPSKQISNRNNDKKGLLAYLFLIFVFILCLGQFNHLFIQDTDWSYFTSLPPNLQQLNRHWLANLDNGRWLNYALSLLIGNVLPARIIYILFLFGYSIFCWIAARLITQNLNNHFIIASLLFISPACAVLLTR